MFLSYKRENRTKNFHSDARFQRDAERRGRLPGPLPLVPMAISPPLAHGQLGPGPPVSLPRAPGPPQHPAPGRLGWGVAGVRGSRQQMTPKESKPTAGLPSGRATKGVKRDRAPPEPPSRAGLPYKAPRLCAELAHPPGSRDVMLLSGSLNVTSASRHPLSSVPAPPVLLAKEASLPGPLP